jgi:predicted ATPase/transcriptional regulator with XRE-family HTH domain
MEMSDPEHPLLGSLLRQFRLAAGLSQEALAERSGLSARGISDMERGLRTSPHLETVRLLAGALELSDEERRAMLVAARPELRRAPEPELSAPTASPAPAHVRAARHFIPVPPTPLIGRDDAISDIAGTIANSEARLLTLTGPGGVGKTRLAIEVALNLAPSYEHGATFVDLSTLSSGTLVIPAILEAAGYSGAHGPDPTETLVGALSNQSLLLVLDNFEHLLDAATVVSTLLSRCADVTILVTSRVRLSIRGEYVFTVSPLELPAAMDTADTGTRPLSEVPAVRLLLDRAAQFGGGFAMHDGNRQEVVSICRRLDGLPLAIELAASWLRVLSPDQLLDRLDQRLPALGGGARDAPARHQTLRDTIAWSLHNLASPEQRLFRRLGAFSGGATFEAMLFVAGSDIPDDIELIEALSSLVENNLVRRQDDGVRETRFLMFETIREFARELLDQSDEADVIRSTHAEWIQTLAERAEPEMVGPNESHWRAVLTAEQANIRAALAWSIAREDLERGLRISGAMWRYWSKSDLIESRDWLTRVLDLPGDSDLETRAKALQALANILHDLGDYPAARRRFEASLAIRRGLPDKSLIANSLNGLGIVAFAEGEFDRARQLHEESLALSREAGHLVGIGNALSNWSTVERALGHFERSRTMQEEALMVRRELGDSNFIGYSLYNLGMLARATHRHADARGLFEEGLDLFRASGDQVGAAFALTELAKARFQLGQWEAGAAAMREAITLRHDLGDQRGLIDCLEGLAEIAADLEHDRLAVMLTGAATVHREHLNSPRSPAEQTDLDLWTSVVRARLDTASYGETLANGRELSIQAALDLAEDVLNRMVRSTDRESP